VLKANSNQASSVGQNVAAIRRRRGLTLEGLSQLSSVSRASISAIENGADNPRIQTLWSLADALGVDFSTLIGECARGPILDNDGASIRLIDRQNKPNIVEAYLLDLPAGIARNAKPHVLGVHEHVVVLTGDLLTGPSDRPRLLKSGQSISFAADVPHIYSAADVSTRAIVTVIYPRLESGIFPDKELAWPQRKSDWETVFASIDRATIEVQNGLGVHAKTLQLAGRISPEKAACDLRKKIATVSPKSTVRHFVIAASAPVILSLYRTPQMTNIPLTSEAMEGELAKRCFDLAGLAIKRLGSYDLSHIWRVFGGTSSLIESALAAEILTRNGTPTVPLGVGTIEAPRENIDPDAEYLFESRIDVDSYAAYELVHPAYARQTLALSRYLPATIGLRILDVGTGPGLPLAMLRELRPDIQAVAVDPSQVAIQHLRRRFAEDPAVEIRQASITELERDEHGFEAVVSIGTSHHLDTSIFFHAIRERVEAGSRVLIADEMVSPFSNREEREIALIRHHLWYILDTLVYLPKDVHQGDVRLSERLSQVLPEAMGMAYAGRSKAARGVIRNLFEEVMQIERPMQPSHPLAVFSRFHLLELQALIAGFDYEVEQKTFPKRFKALARKNGFDIIDHHRIYATDGDDVEDAGTHLVVLEAV
jgi:transcriptional regulator with XRE-family HTH domain/SAM-dependent methyltransferase